MYDIEFKDDYCIMIHCLVESNRLPKGTEIQFIFDTGAGTTQLTWGSIFKLGYVKEDIEYVYPTVPIKTAGGSIETAYKLCLPMLSFEGYNYHNLEVLITDGPVNLFGRDIISCFNWFINYKDFIIDYDLIGIDGEGPQVRPITGNPNDKSIYYSDDICNYEQYLQCYSSNNLRGCEW